MDSIPIKFHFIVLPPTPAFPPLGILGLFTKSRAPAEQEEEGFTPILEGNTPWMVPGNFCHSKSLDSLWSEAGGAWPWIGLGNCGWGQEGVAGPPSGKAEPGNPGVLPEARLGGIPGGIPVGMGRFRLPTNHPINLGSPRLPVLAGIILWGQAVSWFWPRSAP